MDSRPHAPLPSAWIQCAGGNPPHLPFGADMRSLKSSIGLPLSACAVFLCMTAIAATQTPIQDDQKSISKWAEDTVDLGMINEACGGYYFVETGAAGRTFEWYANWGVD